MIQENLSVQFHDGEKRLIRVLLPNDYKNTTEKFPVLYMFDGQNLFNPEDSYTGVTWEVKEALEKLIKKGQAQPMIVVGIDHAGARRLQEYGPFKMEYDDQIIHGQGEKFSEFFVKELIPKLETLYPIEAASEKRFLAGSSMGGLMTVYTSLRYPIVFTKSGVFSLSSWISKQAFTDFVNKNISTGDAQYYIQVGTREGLDAATGKENKALSKTYLEDTMDFAEQLVQGGYKRNHIKLRVGKEDWHSETCWRNYMEDFIIWLQQGNRNN